MATYEKHLIFRKQQIGLVVFTPQAADSGISDGVHRKQT